MEPWTGRDLDYLTLKGTSKLPWDARLLHPRVSTPATTLPAGVPATEQGGDEVMMMQTGAASAGGRTNDTENAAGTTDTSEEGMPDETLVPPAVAVDTTGAGDAVTGANRGFLLSPAERDELIELGWEPGVVENLDNFLQYLEDVSNQAGVETVAWALGQWAHALVLSETTMHLASDVLFQRVTGAAERGPTDPGTRGRLCVGLAGFQKQLGEFHLCMVQSLLRDTWLTANDIGDPPFLGRVGDAWDARTGTAAVALDVARARARELVEGARLARSTRSLGVAASSGVSHGGASSSQHADDAPGGRDADGAHNGEEDDGDDAALMQLTPREEAQLEAFGVNDEVRRRLRDLLRDLGRQDDWDVGAEYRWGVQQLVEAAEGAHNTARCVGMILLDRVRPSEAMRSFPCQRVPPFGTLRTRVVAWMEEFRWVVTQAFDRELRDALRELTGCAPGAPGVLLPGGDPALRRPRASGAPPRGSRSRSRSRADAPRQTRDVQIGNADAAEEVLPLLPSTSPVTASSSDGAVPQAMVNTDGAALPLQPFAAAVTTWSSPLPATPPVAVTADGMNTGNETAVVGDVPPSSPSSTVTSVGLSQRTSSGGAVGVLPAVQSAVVASTPESLPAESTRSLT
eukprot:s715_g10.t1